MSVRDVVIDTSLEAHAVVSCRHRQLLYCTRSIRNIGAEFLAVLSSYLDLRVSADENGTTLRSPESAIRSRMPPEACDVASRSLAAAVRRDPIWTVAASSVQASHIAQDRSIWRDMTALQRCEKAAAVESDRFDRSSGGDSERLAG